MDGWMDGSMYEWVHAWTHRCMDARMPGYMDARMMHDHI